MYRVLAITADVPRLGAGPVNTLRDQLAYLAARGVQADLLLDPNPAEIERKLRTERPHCVYLLPLRKVGAQDEDDALFAVHTRATRLLQHLDLDFVGQDYPSQLALDDKMLTAHVSGMHPPGWLLTRSAMMRDQGKDSIAEVPLEAYPIIVKPNTLWASKGLGPESVCHTGPAIAARSAVLFERFLGLEELRLEKYLDDAREFTVTVMGNGSSLAVAATRFVHQGPNHYIFSETEKTAPPEHRLLSYASMAPDDEAFAPLKAAALDLFERFAFRDVARFDMLWADRLYVVDVNHMPTLGNAMCCPWTVSDNLRVEQLLALLLLAFDQRCGPRRAGGERLPQAIRDSLPPALVSDLVTENR